EWRQHLDDLNSRIDAIEHRPEESWGEHVADLGARIDALPTDAWRPELAAVAENLREHIERVEHATRRPPGSDDIHEIRAAVAAHEAKIGALEAGGSTSDLVAVAESLRQRVQRLEETAAGQTSDAALLEIAAQVETLARRVAAAEAAATDAQ